MDISPRDYGPARDNMVDGQVRPNKVIDPRILRAMRTLPRERFVPPAVMSLAYADEDVPLGRGRVLMQPMVIARLAQLARVVPGELVLVVGAGSGYGAALMAACGGVVTALEDDPALLEIARRILPETAPGVTIIEGPLPAGRPGSWDVIMIEGAVTTVPEAIASQLARPAGRLVTVRAQPGSGGQGVLAEPSGAAVREQAGFDANTAMLPQLAPVPSFQF